MKIDVKAILLIVLTSSLLGIVYNYFSPSGIPLIAEEKKLKWAQDSLFNSAYEEKFQKSDSIEIIKKDNSVGNSSSDVNKNKVNKPDNEKLNTESEKKEETELSEPAAIQLKQAYNLFLQNVLFIDAREPADYQNSHIKNAINIPFDHFDGYKHLLNDINKERIIITYCGGTDCDLSILLGNMLFEMGYKKVYIFFGGWNEWLEADYPIEKESQAEQ